jgi:peptidyl-prolyl cis-trans isomerase D
MKAIMKADASKLPAYAGADLGNDGYGVYRINKVEQPANPDAARRKSEQQQITNAVAQQEMLAYIDSLKKKAKVEIMHDNLQKAETDSTDKK